MKTKPYFTTTVTAQSEEELKARIADNELRGFEVVKIVPIEKEDHVYRGGSKRGRFDAEGK